MALTLRDIQIALGIVPSSRKPPKVRKKTNRAEYGSVQHAAAARGWKAQRLYDLMSRYHLTIDQAIARAEALDTDRAVKTIVGICVEASQRREKEG